MTDFVAIQITSSPSVENNLDLVERQIKQLPKKQQLLVLPECFACFGAGDKAQIDIAETLGNGPIQRRLADLAKRYNKWIVAGSLPIKASVEASDSAKTEKFYAASLVYNHLGERVSRYDKIHLFDVNVDDNTGSYKESNTTISGEKIVTFDSPWGKVGQIICYDLRFPELIQAMPQLDVLVVPSAFTRRTGEAHWHALLKARSIENQCYVVASDQTGVHENGRETYGNSCIYSPWGELLANLPSNEGWVAAKYDNALLAKIRNEMPIQQHKKNRKTI
jgi:predicted amidohydrolase